MLVMENVFFDYQKIKNARRNQGPFSLIFLVFWSFVCVSLLLVCFFFLFVLSKYEKIKRKEKKIERNKKRK